MPHGGAHLVHRRDVALEQRVGDGRLDVQPRQAQRLCPQVDDGLALACLAACDGDGDAGDQDRDESGEA